MAVFLPLAEKSGTKLNVVTGYLLAVDGTRVSRAKYKCCSERSTHPSLSLLPRNMAPH